MKKILNLLAFLFVSVSAFAQNTDKVEMADELYKSGKIYVVVIVLSVIFVGIITYLVLLDRKVSKLEKEINKK